jgi:hypothetical protein
MELQLTLKGQENLIRQIYHQLRQAVLEGRLAAATIGAMCVGLDELPDSEAIRGFVWERVTCLLMSWSPCSIRSGTAKA